MEIIGGLELRQREMLARLEQLEERIGREAKGERKPTGRAFGIF